MRQIPLTQNQFALVDDADFDWLNQFKWCAHWNPCTKSYYAMRGSKPKNGKRHVIRMHREILGLKRGDKLEGDHRNHNTLDNQRENLRAVTCQQNHWNRKNSKGYSWDKRTKKYQARIKLNNKVISLGLFSTTKGAHNAYLQAKKQYHVI